MSGKHEWFEWRGMTCCRKCGIVKRTKSPLSGKPMRMKRCKGQTTIGLREAAQAVLDACDKRRDEPGHFKYVTPWDEMRILHLALDLSEIDPA